MSRAARLPAVLPIIAFLWQADSAALTRITVSGNTFKRGSEEVVPLGGNYAIKAQPYYPEVALVIQNAKAIADGVAAMPYKPSRGGTVVPVVRLPTMLEGAMPDTAGVFDSAWQARLEATVSAFADQGVYVFFDIHQDALATTNGGEGFPVWMTESMQNTAGSVPSCFTCSSSDAYITTPDHPLSLAVPSELQDALGDLGLSLPVVQVVNNTDPWLPYSVGGNAGDPKRMNAGNVNMRANNNDKAWSSGALVLSQQVQNVAWRLYRSHKHTADKEAYFDHVVTFVKYLCSLWANHTNVIAIEMLNEPPPGGLPDPFNIATTRTAIFDYYSAILEALDEDQITTPFSFLDILGTSLQPIFQGLMKVFSLEDISPNAISKLSSWAAKDQLIISFHWYPPKVSESSLKCYIHGAIDLAKTFGNPPIWMSEYWDSTAAATASWMSLAVELGCNAVTWWQYADTNYTETGGWFKYSSEVQAKGGLFDSSGNIIWDAWALYEPTVMNGTYWGAEITGDSGALMAIPVLGQVPQVNASTVSLGVCISEDVGRAPLLQGQPVVLLAVVFAGCIIPCFGLCF